jgi:hypothetical protein
MSETQRSPYLAGDASASARGVVGCDVPSNVAQTGDIIAPLTFAQEALWFIDQLDPGGSAYNVPQVWCLVGSLDVVALRRSLQLVVYRHDALRATFATTDGRPYQRIRGVLQVGLPVVDVGVETPLRDAEAMRLAVDEARRPFDLSEGPLFRASLLRLDTKRHWLVIVMHHIARDGGSMSILRRELGAAYDAFRAGTEPCLAPLSMRYADYVTWQREQLDGEYLEALLSYWRGRLRDAPATVNLPTDHRRRQEPSFAGASERFSAPSPPGGSARTLVARNRPTPAITTSSRPNRAFFICLPFLVPSLGLNVQEVGSCVHLEGVAMVLRCEVCSILRGGGSGS